VDAPRADQQVVVGWGDVDSAGQDRLPFDRVPGRNDPGPAENLRKPASYLGRDVDGDQYGCRQVGGQPGDQGGQHLDAPGGTSDDNQPFGSGLFRAH